MNRRVLKLAVPNILSNLSIPLLSTVDLALMGHLRDYVFLDAVALGGLIFNFLYWGLGFLRMGTTGLTARAFGQKNPEAVKIVLVRSTMLACFLGLALVVIKQPVEAVGFWLLQGSAGVEDQARIYFSIRIWAAPAALTLYAITGWFLGMQNAVYAMVVMVCLNCLNILFNCVFVFGFGMSSDGVALGTVFAQYAGLLLACGLLLRKYPEFLKKIPWKAVKDWHPLLSYLVVHREIFIRTFCLMVVFAYFLNWSAAEGDIVLAVNSILKQYYVWLAYAIDGFAYAAESLIGRYSGAKDSLNLRRALNRIFAWGLGMAALYSCVYGFLGENMLGIFTAQSGLLSAAEPYVIWMVVFPLISAPAFLWDGVFIGMAAVKAMRQTMLASMLVFFLAHGIFQKLGWGNHGLWLAFALFNGSRGLFQWVWFRSRSRFANIHIA